MNKKIKQILTTTRADFLPASLIPFLIGMSYALNKGFSISLSRLIIGLIGIAAIHLAANLLNDYYDDQSGADTQTVKVSSFFGGSRAIQRGLYSAKTIFKFSLLSLTVAFVSVIILLIITKNPILLLLAAIAAILAMEYTAPPLRLAYNRLGELIIFILFGVGLVMGSFYLFTKTITLSSFFISLPISFLVAAIIICNEVPDFESDIKVNKKNLLSITSVQKGYLLYGLVIFLSSLAIILNIINDTLPLYALFTLLIYFLGIKVLLNLKNGLSDINKLIQASRLTIMQHFFVGTANILILLIS